MLRVTSGLIQINFDFPRKVSCKFSLSKQPGLRYKTKRHVSKCKVMAVNLGVSSSAIVFSRSHTHYKMKIYEKDRHKTSQGLPQYHLADNSLFAIRDAEGKGTVKSTQHPFPAFRDPTHTYGPTNPSNQIITTYFTSPHSHQTHQRAYYITNFLSFRPRSLNFLRTAQIVPSNPQDEEQNATSHLQRPPCHP